MDFLGVTTYSNDFVAFNQFCQYFFIKTFISVIIL